MSEVKKNRQSIGRIYLPGNPGQPVGKFQFIVSDDENGQSLEVGAFVAVDSDEGVIVGSVTDMHALGGAASPFQADLRAATDIPNIVRNEDLTIATANVLWAERLRPVRIGTVRFADAAEVERALGQDKIRWKIPVGVVNLGSNEKLPICLDGDFTTGPEAAGTLVAGKSGLASKTSASTVLAKSILDTGEAMGESVAVLFINVKGTDLLALDLPPSESKALSDLDKEMYELMGVKPEPFQNVKYYAPALPGGSSANSMREDAKLVRWDLPMVWPYLGQIFRMDDNLRNLLASMRDKLVENPNPRDRKDTIAKLDDWFQQEFDRMEENQDNSGWQSHHPATMRRAHKLLNSLVTRFGGLVSRESTKAEYDIPVNGWKPGDVMVLDIASLQPDIQGITLGRTIMRLFDAAEAGELGVDRLIITCDELNKFAPSSGGSEFQGTKMAVRDIFARGRYAGISAICAAQKLSRVDPEIVENASTKLLGMSSNDEITSGVYGSKLAQGFIEQVETASKGSMAVFHHLFRQPVPQCFFPRPAWHTGKISGDQFRKGKATDILKMSDKALERLTEGLDPKAVQEIIAEADNREAAIEALKKLRQPDLKSRGHIVQHNNFDSGNVVDWMLAQAQAPTANK